jgi:membrane protease YdiL (CAAX protease family)
MRVWLDDFLFAPLRRAAQEQRDFVNSEEGQRPDWQTMAVLFTAAWILTAQNYLVVGGRFGLVTDLPQLLLPASQGEAWQELVTARENAELARHADWAVGLSATYVLVPVFLMTAVFRRSPADIGVKLKELAASWWVYFLFYLFMLPFLLAVSQTASFQHTYPFYRLAAYESIWPRFLVWELLYAMQFVALEFFFRGFLVHGTRRRFGAYSIFVMMVPYCMIHFGKPVLETCGAIGAGIVLGFMSLKTRSIWLGAALHIAVAWTMDAAAIGQRYGS